MMDIYLLTEDAPKINGANILVDVFTSEEALKAYLAQHIKLSENYGSGVFAPIFDKKYKIQKMQANSDVVIENGPYPEAKLVQTGPLPGEVAPNYVYVTVPSQSEFNKFYGVAVDADDGSVVGCTCKAFEHHNQQQCKHMAALCYAQDPFNIGLNRGLHISRDFYQDPWNKARVSARIV